MINENLPGDIHTICFYDTISFAAASAVVIVINIDDDDETKYFSEAKSDL